MNVVPIDFDEACAYVEKFHRHHMPPQGHKFSIAVAECETGEIHGVAIVGRPTARMSSDGWTLEVTRVATDGTANACSMLYRAAWRATQAMGYRRLITYTLASESGASLRGAGFKCLGQAGGGSWSRKGRPRVDKHPTQPKQKWMLEMVKTTDR